jgi:hypothetical protein
LVPFSTATPDYTHPPFGFAPIPLTLPEAPGACDNRLEVCAKDAHKTVKHLGGGAFCGVMPKVD